MHKKSVIKQLNIVKCDIQGIIIYNFPTYYFDVLFALIQQNIFHFEISGDKY